MIIKTGGIRIAEGYLRGNPDWDVISIRSFEGRVATLAEGWGNKTFVVLNDVGVSNDPAEINRIAVALQRAFNEGKNVFIHCEMGVSRSVGVAYAAAEHFNEPYQHAHHGNSTVKSQVRDALRALEAQHATP